MTARWLELARSGRDAMAQRDRNEPRQVKLDAVARRLELSKGTLANYLDAEAALARLVAQDSGFERQLLALPASAVIVLERWGRHDWDGMARFLKEEKRPSYRRVLAGEQAARVAQGRVPLSQFAALLETMSGWTQGQIVSAAQKVAPALETAASRIGVGPVRFIDLDWTAAVEPYETALGLTHLGRLDLGSADRAQRDRLMIGKATEHALQGDVPVAGVIEVGAQALAENYRRTARMLWTRAVASSTIVPVVVLLFPDADARSRSVPSLPVMPERLCAVASPARRGWFRPLDPSGAVALLTTPQSLLKDWGQAVDSA